MFHDGRENGCNHGKAASSKVYIWRKLHTVRFSSKVGNMVRLLDFLECQTQDINMKGNFYDIQIFGSDLQFYCS